MSHIFQIMRQCDPNFDLEININQDDLLMSLSLLGNIFCGYSLMEPRQGTSVGCLGHVLFLARLYEVQGELL